MSKNDVRKSKNKLKFGFSQSIMESFLRNEIGGKIMKKLFALALAALMTVSMTGCGSDGKSAKESKLVVATQKMNGDFLEGTSNNSYDKDIRDMIHGYAPVVVDEDGFLKWDTKVTLDGEPTAKVNKDGTKTYTIKLNKNLKWNDGEPVTVDDYLFSYMLRASDEWVAAGASDATGKDLIGYEDYLNGKTDTFAGVKKVDDYTYSVTIKKESLPYYWELSYASVAPLPVHHIAKDMKITSDDKGTTVSSKEMKEATDFAKNTYMKNPEVTCGPYKFKGFKNQQVQLELNPEYAGDFRGEKPKIQTIVVKAVDPSRDVDTLLSGEADLVAGVVEEKKIDKAKNDKNVQTSSYGRNGYGNLPLATYYGATKDVNVRHAIAYLIDTNGIATASMGGYGKPCIGDYGAAQKVYADNKEWVDKTLNPYSFSIEKANEALDQSDYKYEKDGKTPFDVTKASEEYLRYNSKGEVLEVKHMGSEQNPITDNVKLQLTANAPKAGVKYVCDIKDFDTMMTNYYAKLKSDEPYNMYNMAVGFSEVPDPELDYSGKYAETEWYNPTGINDEELNACITAIRSAKDYKEYTKAWKDYQVRWNYLLPSIPTYTNDYYDFANVKVKGFKTGPFRNWANEICLYSIE